MERTDTPYRIDVVWVLDTVQNRMLQSLKITLLFLPQNFLR